MYVRFLCYNNNESHIHYENVRIFISGYQEYGEALMYEFKHHSSEAILKRRSFDFRAYEKLAITFFSDCPNFLSLVLHTDLSDITPIHCKKGRNQKDNKQEIVDFFVPKQDFHLRTSSDGLRFSLVKVQAVGGRYFWLVVCEQYRQGFLLPEYVFNRFGHPVRMKRGRPCQFTH